MEVKKLFKDQSGDSALLKNLNKELYLESREHKRMEEAFQEIEDCYRDLLEHTKALLYIHDLQGQFLSVNQGAVELLGYDKDSFLKMNIRNILVPEVKEQFEAYLNEIKGHGVAKGVMLVQTAIGEKRVLEYHNTLRTKGVTSPIVRGIAYDITEHIRAEKAIKRLSQENTIVAEIGRIISSTLNIEEVYERFAEEIHKLISFDAIAVNMVNYKESTISIPYVSEIGVPGCQPREVLPLVGSVTGEVVSKRSGLIFQNEDRNEVKSRFPALLTAFDKGLRSLMVVPLISKDQVIGALHFRSLKSKNFSDQDMKLAEIIGNQIAGTLAIAQLFTELKQADDEIQRNYDTQTVINSLLRLSLGDIPLEEILRQSLDHILSIPWLAFESRGSIFMVEDEPNFLIMKAQKGLAEPIQKACAKVPFGKCHCGQAASRQKIQFSDCFDESHEINYEGIIPHGHYCVPILFTDRILGVINIYVKEGHQRDLKEEEFLTAIANTLAGIIMRKRGEEALLRAAQQWRTTFDSITDMVSLLDLEGRILRCNMALRNFVGKPFNEIINHSCWEIMLGTTTPIEDCPFLRMKETLHRETTTLSMNDRRFNIAIDPILDESGHLIGAVNIMSDITEQKQAEKEIASLQEQLRQSQKMEAIGQLAGGIAHDFNNLLTVIRGYSDLVLSELDQNNPLYSDTLEIKHASEKAESLTRQLLAFSRKQVLQLMVLNVNTLVSNMNKMLRRLIGENIELVTLSAKDLGMVKADPGQIEQVMINLAVNARDAMPKGGKLTIETSNVKLDEEYARTHINVTPGCYVMLSVSDTGIGIPPEIRERIFEPFFTTKEKDKGTGLGLSTVYGIVKQSEGSIWVYSEPGQGTSFKIYLPKIEEEVESTRPEDTSQKLLRGAETILVVEDEEVVRRVVCTILQKNGYHILEATNGKEALCLAQERNGKPIHLMLTDVVMPGMDGPELAKNLSSLYPETKVIYMSGYTDHSIIHREILKPGIPYLQKPFTSNALSRKVREVLDGR